MYLGIDLGTSGVKTLLLNETQDVMAEASSPLMVSRPQPLWSEQHPADWWAAVNNCVQQLKKNFSAEFSNIKTIGLSGQQHGAVLLDKKQNVLRPAILWNDGRAHAECLSLAEKVPDFANITGNLIMPGFTAPKIVWVAKHEPSIFRETQTILLPKDYIRFCLSGDLATDMSDASGTSWLNVKQRDWSDKMLAACHLTRQHMPTLFEGTDMTGTVSRAIANDWGISPQTHIAGGGGDNAASAISMQVIQSGRAFLSLGTSGVFFVATDHYSQNANSSLHTFCHCLPTRWHAMSVHLSAAACLEWAKILFQERTIHQLIEEAATLSNPETPVIFLPYLSGERTPHNNPHAKGLFFGMTHETTRADLIRAILEGVAFAFADGQDAILNAGVVIEETNVTGGGAASEFWGTLLASILNRPLTYRHQGATGAALGAAQLAWLATNQKHPENSFNLSKIEKIIFPQENKKDFYQAKREKFRKLYHHTQTLLD